MTQKIKTTNGYFETIFAFQMGQMALNREFEMAIKRPYPIKTGYWIGRSVNKLESLARIYFKNKFDLGNKYAEKYEADVLKEGKVIFKKGDLITAPNGQLQFSSEGLKAFQNDLEELQNIELELDIDIIEFDMDKISELQEKFNPPNVTLPSEFRLLAPLIKIKQ